jgi:hypothetical protein
MEGEEEKKLIKKENTLLFSIPFEILLNNFVIIDLK